MYKLIHFQIKKYYFSKKKEHSYFIYNLYIQSFIYTFLYIHLYILIYILLYILLYNLIYSIFYIHSLYKFIYNVYIL